ncbi:ubiquitin-protein ligase [Lithospermum erythrorhizon]|uniref:RING-type E3 ubiquitin transferase n=1 Tax=Lithospermum erythrorhizon TaxID=34254 RepID=A0AAV3PUT0_LITER
MAAAALRRRRTPSLETFLTPVDLKASALHEALASLCFELLSSFSHINLSFQKRNFHALLRVINIFSILIESLKDLSFMKMPSCSDDDLLCSTVLLCLKEMYLVLYRSKILLDYCKRSSKLWLLLQNSIVSGHFNDLMQEIYTLLDVFPVSSLELNDDVKEQVELLRKQLRKSKLYVDGSDEMKRMELYSFLNEFEEGRVPDRDDLYATFVEKIKMKDVVSCNAEIEFLEDKIVNHEDDLEPKVEVLNGFVALVRYCRFLLYGFEVDVEEVMKAGKSRKVNKGGIISQEIAETFVKVPKDFCCPVSLDLMSDPVMVCTGQTYERESITRWVDEGHHTCPKTGQLLEHRWVVPNRALRNLITQWCGANGIPYDPPERRNLSNEAHASALPSRATLEANRATARLLIEQLAKGTQGAKTVAARAIRLLAKNGKANRAYIAEAGALLHLKRLLLSRNAVTQENSVTAILNLSIYDKNKSHIMNEEGCLESIVEVLRHGLTTEARENAAATLFSLSSVHDYKKRIGHEVGALEALVGMLREGTPRGRKDAVTALFNLSTHTDNIVRLIESGAVSAFVDALESEIVSEEAAGALGSIVRQATGAEAVGNEEKAVSGLLKMMRSGSPRGKENAVAALLELCRSGGAAAAEKVLRAPTLASLLQLLLFTGTKRAKRKAASLARVYQRCENNMYPESSLPHRTWVYRPLYNC